MSRLRTQRIIAEFPGYLLLLALIYAPWAYGCTRPWSIHILIVLLGAVWAFWALECVLRRRRPRLPLTPVAAGVGVVLQGWWMALNAHSSFDNDHEALLPNSSLVMAGPGSADGPASVSAMLLFTA